MVQESGRTMINTARVPMFIPMGTNTQETGSRTERKVSVPSSGLRRAILIKDSGKKKGEANNRNFSPPRPTFGSV